MSQIKVAPAKASIQVVDTPKDIELATVQENTDANQGAMSYRHAKYMLRAADSTANLLIGMVETENVKNKCLWRAGRAISHVLSVLGFSFLFSIPSVAIIIVAMLYVYDAVLNTRSFNVAYTSPTIGFLVGNIIFNVFIFISPVVLAIKVYPKSKSLRILLVVNFVLGCFSDGVAISIVGLDEESGILLVYGLWIVMVCVMGIFVVRSCKLRWKSWFFIVTPLALLAVLLFSLDLAIIPLFLSSTDNVFRGIVRLGIFTPAIGIIVLLSRTLSRQLTPDRLYLAPIFGMFVCYSQSWYSRLMTMGVGSYESVFLVAVLAAIPQLLFRYLKWEHGRNIVLRLCGKQRLNGSEHTGIEWFDKWFPAPSVDVIYSFSLISDRIFGFAGLMNSAAVQLTWSIAFRSSASVVKIIVVLAILLAVEIAAQCSSVVIEEKLGLPLLKPAAYSKKLGAIITFLMASGSSYYVYSATALSIA